MRLPWCHQGTSHWITALASYRQATAHGLSYGYLSTTSGQDQPSCPFFHLTSITLHHRPTRRQHRCTLTPLQTQQCNHGIVTTEPTDVTAQCARVFLATTFFAFGPPRAHTRPSTAAVHNMAAGSLACIRIPGPISGSRDSFSYSKEGSGADGREGSVGMAVYDTAKMKLSSALAVTHSMDADNVNTIGDTLASTTVYKRQKHVLSSTSSGLKLYLD